MMSINHHPEEEDFYAFINCSCNLIVFLFPANDYINPILFMFGNFY